MAFRVILTAVILCANAFVTNAADCNTAQYRRGGDPSGQDISSALLGDNGATLDNVCSGGFPPGSQTTATFNTGSLIYNVTRSDPNQSLQHCQAGFNNIIQQCIINGKYWGGTWTLDGETYTLSDQSWPDHTLPAELLSSAGGAQLQTQSSSSTSNGAGAGSGTTTTITTTINGSPISETFVPTTVSGVTAATTTSTSIDGVIVPLILGPLGVGWIPFVPVSGVPPVPGFPPPSPPGDGGDGGDEGDNNPTVTPTTTPPTSSATSTSSSAASSTSSAQPVSLTQTEHYQVSACGRDAAAAARTTTFTTKGGISATSTRPAGQTVTNGCQVCVLPAGSTDPQCNPIPGCVPSASSTPPPASSTPTVAGTPMAAFPTATGVNCGTDSTGGTRMIDCLSILFNGDIPNDSTQICTNDNGKCVASGESVGGDPQVTTSNYCQVSSSSGCALVIANKLSSFGFPGL